MSTSLTPTTHGAWRVIDGKLVDESTLPPFANAPIAPNTAPPSLPKPTPVARRKAPAQPE